MPKINRDEYNAASVGGSFKEFCPGAYIGRIQAVRTEWEEMDWSMRERVTKTAETDKAVMFIFDIAEGEFAGEFSRDFYFVGGKLDETKDFMHRVKYSWNDLRDLKRFDDALKASNPGFDPEAAFDADKWELYVGKLFGFVADGTHVTKDNGFDGWRNVHVKDWKVYSVDDIRDGKHDEPRITDKRVKQEPAQADTYSDVPF